MDYRTIYIEGTQLLSPLPDAKLDARLLLEAVCHTDLQTLLVHPDREVTGEEEALYWSYLRRRSAREPLAYILGSQEFMGLPFKVDPAVLIPNQDTETLVETALESLQEGDRVLDLCTGSGCILLSLLHYKKSCSGTGTDLSHEALRVARANGEGLGLSSRAIWKQGDLFLALEEEEAFDLIVSNPPYIRSDVIESLEPEVKNGEPRMALDGGEDGLYFYREIIARAPAFLKEGGRLMMEIGFDQGEAVRALLAENEYREIRIIRDYGGLDRVAAAAAPFRHQAGTKNP